MLPEKFPQTDRYLSRIIATALAAPKVFLGAMTWEGFSLLATMSGLAPTDSGYYFMTGLGDFLGIFVASLILMHIQCLSGHEYMKELHSTILLAVASGIFAGSLWQFSVNLGVEDEFTFTETFFMVGSLGIAMVFLSFFLLRLANEALPENFRLILEPAFQKLPHDFQLAFTLGVADAFFVATDGSDFIDNWLSAFAIYSSTDLLTSLMLAGSSATVGFLCAQVLLIFTLDDTWVDTFHIKLVRSLSMLGEMDQLDSQSTSSEGGGTSSSSTRFAPAATKPSTDSILSLDKMTTGKEGTGAGHAGEDQPLLSAHGDSSNARRPRSESDNGIFF